MFDANFSNMNWKYLAFLFVAGLVFTSCGDDEDPEPPNMEEVITTLNYTLTSGSGVVTLSFQDLDGDGGNAPTVTGGTLQANTVYAGVLQFLNEQEDPAENVTEEIEEEDDEHQVFFSNDVGLTVAYGDADGDGNPLGVLSSLTTGDAGTGTLTITLRHEPMKDAEGVSGGDITNAGGETDISVTFDITVE